MNNYRQAARRLSAGSAEVARRMGTWAASGGGGAVTAKAVVLIAGAPAVIRTAHQQPLLMPVAASAWCIAAWRAAGSSGDLNEDETAEETEEWPAPDAAVNVLTAEQAYTFLINRIRSLIGDRNGVHLDVLLAQLRKDGVLLVDGSVSDLRRDLEARDIPTRYVKVAGLNRMGVHRDDLPPLLQPLPGPALADAG